MSTTTSPYEQQAVDFLTATGTKIKFRYVEHNYHFEGDKERRDIWDITLRNSRGSRRFKFGQSIANSGQQPTAYDLLRCIQKNDPGTLEDFCSEMGYDSDSRKAEKIYKAVIKEWAKVDALFDYDELEKLQEIQ